MPGLGILGAHRRDNLSGIAEQNQNTPRRQRPYQLEREGMKISRRDILNHETVHQHLERATYELLEADGNIPTEGHAHSKQNLRPIVY